MKYFEGDKVLSDPMSQTLSEIAAKVVDWSAMLVRGRVMLALWLRYTRLHSSGGDEGINIQFYDGFETMDKRFLIIEDNKALKIKGRYRARHTSGVPCWI